MIVTLDLWLPKVRSGGIVAGYDPTRFNGAVGSYLAVENYTELNGIVPQCATNNPHVYWFITK